MWSKKEKLKKTRPFVGGRRKGDGPAWQRCTTVTVIGKSGSVESHPVRSVPYPEEAVPRTSGHSHAISGHAQTADPVVVPS